MTSGIASAGEAGSPAVLDAGLNRGGQTASYRTLGTTSQYITTQGRCDLLQYFSRGPRSRCRECRHPRSKKQARIRKDEDEGTMTYAFHEVADIFPLMQGEEFAQLVSDIKEHGLRESIWLYGDQIIDGRNRYRACQEAEVEPAFREWEGEGSLVAFVLSLNLHRRHLDESQRSIVAAKIANMRQGARTDLEPSANLPEVSQAEAADLLNVSERSVRSAKGARAGGEKDSSRGTYTLLRDPEPTLVELGLTKRESSQAQRLGLLLKNA